MKITFKTEFNSQKITLDELNTFETFIRMKLPENYRQHMLNFNGGEIEEDNVEHKNYKEGGRGIPSAVWISIPKGSMPGTNATSRRHLLLYPINRIKNNDKRVSVTGFARGGCQRTGFKTGGCTRRRNPG